MTDFLEQLLKKNRPDERKAIISETNGKIFCKIVDANDTPINEGHIAFGCKPRAHGQPIDLKAEKEEKQQKIFSLKQAKKKKKHRGH